MFALYLFIYYFSLLKLELQVEFVSDLNVNWNSIHVLKALQTRLRQLRCTIFYIHFCEMHSNFCLLFLIKEPVSLHIFSYIFVWTCSLQKLYLCPFAEIFYPKKKKARLVELSWPSINGHNRPAEPFPLGQGFDLTWSHGHHAVCQMNAFISRVRFGPIRPGPARPKTQKTTRQTKNLKWYIFWQLAWAGKHKKFKHKTAKQNAEFFPQKFSHVTSTPVRHGAGKTASNLPQVARVCVCVCV